MTVAGKMEFIMYLLEEKVITADEFKMLLMRAGDWGSTEDPNQCALEILTILEPLDTLYTERETVENELP